MSNTTATDPRPVVVLDLDNCCANDAWRIPYIEWHKTGDARYHIYHALAMHDENDFDTIARTLQRNVIDPDFARFFVLTARGNAYRRTTQLWLEDHCSWPIEAILMRNNGDHRHSEQLKAEQLHMLFAHHGVSEVAIAFDDRQQVLDAYRATGLPVKTTVLHAIHDVCAYTGPQKPAPRRAPDFLREGASIYEQRNALYGDNYKVFGHAMVSVFPRGLTIKSVDDWNRLGILVQAAAKLTRYGQSFLKGGHLDSAQDLSVYAAMLAELTNEEGK